MLAAPSDKLGAERVEPLAPEGTERVEPAIDLPQGTGLHCVEAARSLCPNPGEPAFTQDAQVLGDSRLADAELVCDDGHDLARRAFILKEELEDASADRIAEDVECMHRGRVSVTT